MKGRPAESEYAPYFAKYVGLVPEDDVLPALQAQVDQLRAVCANVPADRESFAYAPGKWTYREVTGHLGDAERVFWYRALGISRGDQTRFPSFDENLYVANAGFDAVPLQSLLEEFVHLRASNLALLERLERGAWERMGTASERPISVRALAYIMVGHVRHHVAILHERYGGPQV